MNKLFILIPALLLLTVFIVYSFNNKEKYTLSTEFEYYTTRMKNKIINNGEKYTIPFPVYYINMDKNKDRMKNILDQKKYVNANMIRVRAFNGNLIKNKKQDTVDGISFINHYTYMTKPEIGCCMSHLLAIDTAWKNGDDVAMIVEDDISFLSTGVIPRLEDIIGDAPGDWDIIQLFSVALPEDKGDRVRYIKRGYPSSSFVSACCYLINRRGMEKIISHVKPDMNQPVYHIIPERTLTDKEINDISNIDLYTDKVYFPAYGNSDFYIYDLVNTYTTSISLFILNSEIQSTIHVDHDLENMKYNLIMMKRLDKYIVD